ncbi:MAG: HAMP domain-containing histidine kinase, partial [Acidimicrobiia bacterium]|nr:HAMP domain-containing histidine kinase [Acidimicrobiia bacterium]
MTFRARVAATAALAVAVAVVLVSVAAYGASSRSLRAELDQDLEETATELINRPEQIVVGLVLQIERDRFDDGRFDDFRGRYRAGFGELPAGQFGGASAFAQVVDTQGRLASLAGDVEVPADFDYLPIDEQVVAVAAGTQRSGYYETVDIDGAAVRILTEPLAPGLALQVARPLDEVEASLNQLAIFLGIGSLGGVALAAGLGLIVARLAVRPVVELTASAEHVAETRDLSFRIETASPDELGRLGRSFNTMLEALENSEDARRQLVADASHELRTPLTSLRTNIEVLADAGALSDMDRAGLVGDVVQQLDELNLLVSDLIDAAREADEDDAFETLDLAAIVRDAAERAARNHPTVALEVDAEPVVVNGVPRRLGRAVGTLLDNAAKWSP